MPDDLDSMWEMAKQGKQNNSRRQTFYYYESYDLDLF